ncbi:hypothetical protein B0H14DRAFT_3136996 [Mycena olivaceomarginata]|nr:hypothetical protein B0H14DRAFT_3136996 [Mycena olivaceomarginata]
MSRPQAQRQNCRLAILFGSLSCTLQPLHWIKAFHVNLETADKIPNFTSGTPSDEPATPRDFSSSYCLPSPPGSAPNILSKLTFFACCGASRRPANNHTGDDLKCAPVRQLRKPITSVSVSETSKCGAAFVQYCWRKSWDVRARVDSNARRLQSLDSDRFLFRNVKVHRPSDGQSADQFRLTRQSIPNTNLKLLIQVLLQMMATIGAIFAQNPSDNYSVQTFIYLDIRNFLMQAWLRDDLIVPSDITNAQLESLRKSRTSRIRLLGIARNPLDLEMFSLGPGTVVIYKWKIEVQTFFSASPVHVLGPTNLPTN